MAERSEGDSRGGEAETLLQVAPTPFTFLSLFRTSQEPVKFLVGAGLSGQLDSGFLSSWGWLCAVPEPYSALSTSEAVS